MSICRTIAITCCATALSMGVAQAEMPSPTTEELAAWSAAYGALEAMTPKWGVESGDVFRAMSGAGVPVVYLDVRTEAEWEKGIIEGAVRITLTDLATEAGMAQLPDSKTAIIAVYCKSGHRSALAIPLLHRYGYVNAISMSGGYSGWAAAGYPVENARD